MILPPVRVVRCAPKAHPCPTCGKLGRRVRSLRRKVRSLAYRQEAWLDVRSAEYKAACPCCQTFRSWPLDVPPKADYDALVRTAVLDRMIADGLNVQRTRLARKRDYCLDLSEGFIYDCLRWKVGQLDLPAHRQLVSRKFSGTLCVDELHLGRFTLLLATDPLSDLPVAFALVSRNDQQHLQRWLHSLKSWGLLPRAWSRTAPTSIRRCWPNCGRKLGTSCVSSTSSRTSTS